MVSVEPYSVSEYIFLIMSTYALWFIYVFTVSGVCYLGDGNLFKPLYTKLGTFGGAGTLVAAGCVAISLLYLLPMRIGTVMMINGIIMSGIGQGAYRTFRIWQEAKEEERSGSSSV